MFLFADTKNEYVKMICLVKHNQNKRLALAFLQAIYESRLSLCMILKSTDSKNKT